MTRAKIVFSDAGHDKALTGELVSEDDFFFFLACDNGRKIRIGKKSVVAFEEQQ